MNINDKDDAEEEGTHDWIPNLRLRRAREARGWSRRKVANLLHEQFPETAATEAEVGRWERGKRKPGPFYRERLAAIFESSVEELGLIEPDPEPVPPAQLAQAQGMVLLTREQAVIVSEYLTGGSAMAGFDPLKRKTLEQLVGILGVTATSTTSAADLNLEPFERLTAARTKTSALNADALQHFEHLISDCWQLSNSNQLVAAEGILSKFLPDVLALPPTSYEGKAAFLASQGLRLHSVLIHHRLKIADKVAICEQSVALARISNDANTLAIALVELADAYEFAGNMDKCLYALQEALHSCAQATPLVQSRVYSNNAIILAHSGRQKEADFYIGLARDVFPDHPEDDPAFALADSSVFTLSYHTGLVHLDAGRMKQSADGFETYAQHPAGVAIPERLRLEIVNGKSKTAIASNDLELYLELFEAGLIGSVELGSKKRFEEAYTIFQREMPQTWLANGQVRAVMEKYQLKRAV